MGVISKGYKFDKGQAARNVDPWPGVEFSLLHKIMTPMAAGRPAQL